MTAKILKISKGKSRCQQEGNGKWQMICRIIRWNIRVGLDFRQTEVIQILLSGSERGWETLSIESESPKACAASIIETKSATDMPFSQDGMVVRGLYV